MSRIHDFVFRQSRNKIGIKWYYTAFVPIYLNFKMFFIYIIQSEKNKSFYVGSCENFEYRLKLHNKGSVKSTKRYIPWVLVYKENFHDLKDARKRELQIKSWKKEIELKS